MPNRFPRIAVLPALAAAAQGTRPEAAAFGSRFVMKGGVVFRNEFK
jgi:hypothetical protein